MESVTDRMPIIAQHLEEDNLDAAANMVENIIREATNPQRNRRAKAWFDAQCYRTRQQTLQALREARRTNNPEDLQTYAAARKTYKNLLSLKKAEHKEAEARKTTEAALKDPHLALRQRKAHSTYTIEMETWEKHFTKILNLHHSQAACKVTDTSEKTTDYHPISRKEVNKIKCNKQQTQATYLTNILSKLRTH